jgi:hypothetical protein
MIPVIARLKINGVLHIYGNRANQTHNRRCLHLFLAWLMLLICIDGCYALTMGKVEINSSRKRNSERNIVQTLQTKEKFRDL